MGIDYDGAEIGYPYRTPLEFFHLPWLVDLIRGKSVCDLGCQAGDAMVQMAEYASSVRGIEIREGHFNRAKARGLDVQCVSWDKYLPTVDVYHVWAQREVDVVSIVRNGAKTLVFQAPLDWITDDDLWEVQPNNFSVEPVIKESELKGLAERIGGGELEFRAYSFDEPVTEKDDFPKKGWRHAFVFKKAEKPEQEEAGLDGGHLLLIAGQHRSGTSALTGSLDLLGGYLGTDKVIEPDQYNEKGYFENRGLFHCHVRIMRHFGDASGWLQFAPFPDGFENGSDAEPLIAGLAAELRTQFATAGGRTLVVKDPRASFFIPFYRKAVESISGVKMSVIFSDRLDSEMADSLKRRNKFDAVKSDALAVAHRAAFEREKDSVDHVYVSTFDCLSYKPDRFFAWLDQRFGLGLDLSAIPKVMEFLDMGLRHHSSGKNVKVISTYFGPRRTKPHMVEETIEWMKEVVDLERSLDKGEFCDTVIVNHDIAALLPGGDKAHEYLDSIDGSPTRNGVMKVVSRPWADGVGASYGSFSYAFGEFQDEYDYWFFTEDNVIQIRGNYLAESIQKIKDTGCAFVCAMEWLTVEETAKKFPLHCHGGCGAAHVSVLAAVYDRDGFLPHCREPMPHSVRAMVESGQPYKLQDDEGRAWYKKFERQGEVAFTNVFAKDGLEILDLKTGPVSKWRGKVY